MIGPARTVLVMLVFHLSEGNWERPRRRRGPQLKLAVRASWDASHEQLEGGCLVILPHSRLILELQYLGPLTALQPRIEAGIFVAAKSPS